MTGRPESNRALEAGIDRDAFRHEVRVLHDPLRVVAHLVADRAHTWRPGPREIRFAPGGSVRVRPG